MSVEGCAACRVGDTYLRLRRQGCGFHLSDMAWHCKDDTRSYPGQAEPCAHVKDAIPDWARDL